MKAGMKEMTKKRLAKEIDQDTTGTLRMALILSRKLFRMAKDAEDFMDYVTGTSWKNRIIEAGNNPKQLIPVLQEVADLYGRANNVAVWQYQNDEVVEMVFREVMRQRFTADFSKANAPELYRDLYTQTGEYMWHDTPLRGHLRLPAEVGKIAGAVFNHKIEKNLSAEERLRWLRKENSRSKVTVASDAELDEFITKLLKEHPLESYDSWSISGYVDAKPQNINDRLMLLARHNPEIMRVKTPKHKTQRYKWYPSCRIHNLLHKYCRAVHTVLELEPRTNKNRLRKLVCKFLGSSQNVMVDAAIKTLVEVGMIRQESGKGKEILYSAVGLPQAQEKDIMRLINARDRALREQSQLKSACRTSPPSVPKAVMECAETC